MMALRRALTIHQLGGRGNGEKDEPILGKEGSVKVSLHVYGFNIVGCFQKVFEI